MTIVCWDGRMLAADKLATGGVSKLTITKIHRLPDGAMAGFAGEAALGMQMLNWYMNGCKIEEFPQQQRDNDNVEFMVITREKKILIYERSPYPLWVEDGYYAIGSGAAYALAALYLGHGAMKAVEVAIACCPSCGGGTDKLVWRK